MKIHVVGGFLGSGKTTAILAAARRLMDSDQKVGIITNDQGRYLVDTAFFRLAELPAVEVTGGCFCCHYDDLDTRLNELIAQQSPDVIFAESVGSCADLVATVVRPLLELRAGNEGPASYSVFADGRLLRLHLLGEMLPFSEDVVYIYEKQIEEAGLLVINKIDLLAPDKLAEVQRLASAAYPQKKILLQNSLVEDGADAWLQTLQSEATPAAPANLEIDYQRYGAGEAQLAWLDETITLTTQRGYADVAAVLSALLEQLQAAHNGIGHLKFLIQCGDVHLKLSLPTLEEPGWQEPLAALPAGDTQVLINARIEMDAEELHHMLTGVLNASGLTWQPGDADYFHPGKPEPTHHISG